MNKKMTLFTKKSKLRAVCMLAGFSVLCSLPYSGSGQYGLYGFGDQGYGQLGNGTTGGGTLNPNTNPIHNDVNNRFKDLSGGQWHTLAIKEDGSLWAWGRNNSRQLGDPNLSNAINYALPQLIDNGQGSYGKWAKVFAIGISSSFAIAEDGSLWAWGTNTNNRLGLPGTPGTTVDRPTQVMPGSKWLMVSGGDDDGLFTIGLQADSTLWVWGANNATSHTLGTGNATAQAVPFAIMPGEKWRMISSGNKYTLAIHANGSLWGWGNRWTSLAGAFGDTTLSAGTYNQPKLLDQGAGTHGKWVMVSSRNLHTQAIREDGSLWGWGQNTSGRIGDGTNAHPLGRKMVDNGQSGKWSNVLAGHQWSLAIKENNEIYVWGEPIMGPSNYNVYSPKLITEAGNQGTLVNGRIYTGRTHGFWINEYPIVCPGTLNRTISQLTVNGGRITWPSVPGVIGYDIAIDQSATAAPAGSSQNITDTTYAASGLNAGTKYYAHIRTSCGLASYSAWDTISFTTLPCLSPQNLSAGSIGVDGATINWGAAGSATDYEIAIDQTAALAPSGTSTSLTGTSHNTTGLAAGTTYYAHIRTNCGGGNYSDWDTVSFTTLPCLAPLQIEANTIRSTQATIQWAVATHAQGYEVVVDQTAALAPSGTPLQVSGTSHNALSLNPGNTYYAHVRTHCGGTNYSDWDTVSFTTLPLCLQAPNLMANNVSATTAEINWDDVVLAIEYEIAIDKSATLQPAGSASSQTTTQFSATQLDAGETYFVHLRSNCGNDNYSEWDTLSFTTADPSLVSTEFANGHTRIYPNPVKDVLHIQTGVPVSAIILNVQGQQVFTGSNIRAVNVTDLPAGLYMLQLNNLNTGAPMGTQRFLKENK